MSSGIIPPIQIVAAGLCPQGLSGGDTVRDVVGCDVISAGTGQWQVTMKDKRVLPNNGHALIAVPGNAANVGGGITFGQGSASVNSDGFTVFQFSTYASLSPGVYSGALIDVETQFIVVRWPNVPTNVE